MIDYGFGIKLETMAESEDFEALFHMRNKPEIWKWCRQVGPIHFDHHMDYWTKVCENDGKDTRMYLARNGTKIAGCAGFTSIDHINSRAEFSCYVDTDMRGIGIGAAVLKTLFSFGFKMLNFNSIWGESFDGNPAMKIFDKIGMTREGVRRQFYFRDGAFIDAHLFGILRSEWKF